MTTLFFICGIISVLCILFVVGELVMYRLEHLPFIKEFYENLPMNNKGK